MSDKVEQPQIQKFRETAPELESDALVENFERNLKKTFGEPENLVFEKDSD